MIMTCFLNCGREDYGFASLFTLIFGSLVCYLLFDGAMFYEQVGQELVARLWIFRKIWDHSDLHA